jgi:hypothetical protein
LLDQLAHLLDGLWRAVAVIATNEVDLATVDAAMLIDHTEVGGFCFADDSIGRCRAAIRHRVANFDLTVADAWSVLTCG